jgi:hypothetical protein
MLEKLAENLWVVNQPLSVAGLALGARMTVIRFADGGLLLHSPTKFDDETRIGLEQLGPVRYVVAPNSLHHLFVQPYLDHYHDAEFWTVPQVIKKNPSLRNPKLLTEGVPADWALELHAEPILASTKFCEVVFFHKPTGTLIVTDLLFNLKPPGGLIKYGLYKLMKLSSPIGPSRVGRRLFGESSDFKATVHKLLEWETERIIMCHGEIVDEQAKEALRVGFQYLL